MILCNLKTEMHESIKVNVKGYQSYLMVNSNSKAHTLIGQVGICTIHSTILNPVLKGFFSTIEKLI